MVCARLGAKQGSYRGFCKGAFNIGYRVGVQVDAGQDLELLVRFAMPGQVVMSWRDEKVANEVRTLEYIREHTSIPVSKGTKLSALMRRPTDGGPDGVSELNPDVDEAVLDVVYEQVADYLLQMSRLTFPRIGALSKDADGSWVIAGRPLTLDMNLLATATGYPVDQFPTAPLDSQKEYFDWLSRQYLQHYRSQRNLGSGADDARRRYIARHRFHQLAPRFCLADHDTGPFVLCCDDMSPLNMLVDAETLRITGVVDWEWTNSMPAQFSYDPPWWLLLKPAVWVEDDGMSVFLECYVPRMEQFLRALERVEARSSVAAGGPPLSARMRESWRTKRFWFDEGARRALDVDTAYWEALHDEAQDGDGLCLLDSERQAEVEHVVRTKVDEWLQYMDEREAKEKEDEERAAKKEKMRDDASRPRLVIQMAGAPGSGKSLMANLLQESLSGLVIDHDLIRSSILKSTKAHGALAWDEIAKMAYGLQWAFAESSAQQGLRTIIVDSCCNFEEVLDRGFELVSQHRGVYWYVECRVDDMDVLEQSLGARVPMRSQRPSVDKAPEAAAGACAGEDPRAQIRRWIDSPCRPARNVVVVDSAGDIEKARDEVLKQILAAVDTG